jgi:hypothetical protein
MRLRDTRSAEREGREDGTLDLPNVVWHTGYSFLRLGKRWNSGGPEGSIQNSLSGYGLCPL